MDEYYWLALAAFLLAGTIKGALGIGLPTTVISILSQFGDPRTAVALAIMPIMLSNTWQFYREGRMAETARRYWPFSVTLAVVMFAASFAAVGFSAESMMLATGLAIGVFAAVSLFRHPPALPDRYFLPAQVISGALAGVLGGFTGLWSPPMIILLLARRLERDDYVRTFGFMLMLGAPPLLIGYVANGYMTLTLFLASLGMCAPTFLGYVTGERVRKRIDTSRYQKFLLLFFLIMGLNLIRRVVMG